MGYLMKEALKTLCGVNKWAYAVFWKIGCQNPKLLIWEECYYEFARSSGIPGTENTEAAFHHYNNFSSDVVARDKVHALVNRMMIDSYVNVIGVGLVGRVAFTGNYQWMLSKSCYQESHPCEVIKEACQQFSAGMQTVAVIPVLPHGVVQFGSFLTIADNVLFVNDVTSLLLQLGYASGVFQSEEFAVKLGVPEYPENSAPMRLSLKSNVNESPYFLNNPNFVGNTSQSSVVDIQTSFSVVGEIQNDLQSNGAAFPASTLSQSTSQLCQNGVKITQINAVAKAEVIPSNSKLWMNQHASVYIPRSAADVPHQSSSTEKKIFSDTGNLGNFEYLNASAGIQIPSVRTTSGLKHYSVNGSATRASAKSHERSKGTPVDMKPQSSVDIFSDMKWTAHGNASPNHLTSTELASAIFTSTSDPLMATSMLACNSGGKRLHMDSWLRKDKSNACKEEIEQNTVQCNDIPGSDYEFLNVAAFSYGFIENEGTKYESGDELFDVLGADFKNKLFSGSGNGCPSYESTPTMHCHDDNNLSSKNLAGSEICSTSEGNSKSGIFFAGADNLLEAVVSQVGKRSLDVNESSKTTLTSTNSSLAPSTSLPYGRFVVSNHMKGELCSVAKSSAKAGTMGSCSLITELSKEELTSYSQGSFIYGSQISSWIQEAPKAKPNHSASTSHNKKPEETGKTNRKRLKAGENPRPRPKDRQMIQDRVKELREIVPNGAKCSIDALLERTIKHMLFLQSVTKHADKLKQADDSKIISKNGDLLLKDNFERGGATWAYEVGSQSTVCPIIVEDLKQPRQMFVEMLCEERGLFLEIAEVIRGLGLTILKGVMEILNDKIWARFTVEANRDVTRMEIFISLVRLLEKSAKQPNGISNENVMDGQHFHQSTADPVPYGPPNLQ